MKGEVTARDSAGVVAALGDGGKLSNVDNYVNVTAGTNIVESEEQYSQAKVAGLVAAVKNGDTGCEITNCKNYGKIKSEQTIATDAVGGILAWSNVKKLTITGCENHGTVTAGTKQNAGGIIGEVAPVNGTATHEITLTGYTNNGTISTTNGKAGGIIGRSTIGNTELKLEDCTSTNTTDLIGQGTYTNVSGT